MLAQSFKSAADLDITDPQRNALIKTLVLLETDKLTHARVGGGWFDGTGETFTGHFNMCQWNSVVNDCGTVCCIGGTAELIGNVQFDRNLPFNSALHRLFMPNFNEDVWNDITPSQAAIALRNYLTTGNAKWHEAIRA